MNNPFPYSDSNKRYHTFNYFLRHHFGCKVAKVSLDAGFTCPNLDGTKGTGGCTYCSSRGSGDFAGDVHLPLDRQFEQVRQMMDHKWEDTLYIPYFQAHTNTYAPLPVLREKFEQALNFPNVAGLAIATRADCISDETADYLGELAQRTYLEVELGSDDQSGLKIPNSAITTKEFLLIPSDYISQGDNSSDQGVIKITTDNRGKESAEFIQTDIYDTDEENNVCYIDEESLSVGDVIQKPDSDERYTIRETGEKEGVYNMNRGYAVFRIIEPVSNNSNEEYTIVETGTSYGLSLYDRIALDGSSVTEGEFAN